MIITRTPYRISFFGGGTDHPSWYRRSGGQVLGATIDKYCYVSCRYLPPFFKYRFRIVYSKDEMVRNEKSIQHPIVRECLRFLKFKHGLEIHHDGDLPARTGLGTSSSFTVGLLHALYALKGKLVGKQKLAHDAIYIEQKKAKDVVGSQDQVAAAFGGFNKIEFAKNGEITVNPIILPKTKLNLFTRSFMLFFTGFTRFASEIESDKIRNFNKKKKELEQLSRMVDIGCDTLTKGKLQDFGTLLHESWLKKRSLSTKVSTPYIDAIYQDALKAGATGGKILGAGGGGFMLLFVEPDLQKSVRRKLKKLLEIPFEFENTGSQVVFYKPEYLFSFRKNAKTS